MSLKEVSMDLVKTSRRDVIARWFHSSQDADLFIWMDLQRNIIKQQLSYYGQVVEWNVIEGVKTGHVVVEDSHVHGQRSEFLSFDERPQRTSVDQALRLLSAVTALKDDERKVLEENFLRFNQSQVMPAAEVVARFGELMGRGDLPPAENSLWKRFVSRLSRWFKA